MQCATHIRLILPRSQVIEDNIAKTKTKSN
uniref:Uncharacterized protein n=1 Tax=Arundo donax TaxID=35708 RepID=A0A0A8YN43_ARUDO